MAVSFILDTSYLYLKEVRILPFFVRPNMQAPSVNLMSHLCPSITEHAFCPMGTLLPPAPPFLLRNFLLLELGAAGLELGRPFFISGKDMVRWRAM